MALVNGQYLAALVLVQAQCIGPGVRWESGLLSVVRQVLVPVAGLAIGKLDRFEAIDEGQRFLGQ
ncbi:hypothetical protein D3C80_2181930 [compost metagenome]